MLFRNIYQLVLILISCHLQESWSRFIALSLNLSMALSDEHHPALSADIVRSCKKETDHSMAAINRLHMNIVNDELGDAAPNGEYSDITVFAENIPMNDNDDGNGSKLSVLDYDSNAPLAFKEGADESTNCFTHCLYERLGLVKDGIFMEHDLFRKFYKIIGHEKTNVKECTNMDSDNKCEISYKLHLCYSKLKSIDAERRIREILEYDGNVIGDGDGGGGGNDDADNGGADDGATAGDGDQKVAKEMHDNEIEKE